MSKTTLVTSKHKPRKTGFFHRRKSPRTVENNTGWFNIDGGEKAATRRSFLDHRSPSWSAHISKKASQAHLAQKEYANKEAESSKPHPQLVMTGKLGRIRREALARRIWVLCCMMRSCWDTPHLPLHLLILVSSL